MQTTDSHRQLRIGTRASPMARAMADTIRDIIISVAPSLNPEILAFVAEGDKIKGCLQSFGGKGTFIKDLERRLLAHEIDCAVHSLKDIPGDLPPHKDLTLISFLPREDPRDALILREGVSEVDLRVGGVIGSSAPRRQAALKKLYTAAEVRLCRGNVNSRLKNLDEGKFDAIVLSYAGLKRLKFESRVARIFQPDEMLPAVGQGIMSLQVRKEDAEKCPYLKKISDPKAEIAASVERAMLFRLNGNCHSAIAGYCSFLSDTRVQMCGIVYNPETGDFLKSVIESDVAADIENLGTRVADDLIAQGARDLIAA